MRMAEYMEKHIGEEFNGIVTNIGSRSMKVRTDDGISGVINYSDMIDDNYIYYYEQNKIVGKKTNAEYKLGSPIKFIVKDASKKNRTITFAGASYKKEIGTSKTYKKKG